MRLRFVVEGQSDTGVVSALARYCGHTVGAVTVKRGTGNLDRLIPKYCAASMHGDPYVVFRDTDGACPVELFHQLTARLPERHPHFCLRLAHSMTEAWLLADRGGFAAHFSVREAHVPRDAESLPHAKRALIRTCATSRSRRVREAIVAAGDKPGPLYVEEVNVFARETWNIADAMQNSESLRRAVRALRTLE